MLSVGSHYRLNTDELVVISHSKSIFNGLLISQYQNLHHYHLAMATKNLLVRVMISRNHLFYEHSLIHLFRHFITLIFRHFII